ncbi:MAG: phytoene/squalene synthase family protein [Flavobacteriales bacterium]|nr:phytoene/squalene synthase family protein [Flavobacteriales bacterium]
MTNKPLYDQVSLKCSRYITNTYSTSFSLGIKLLSKDLRSHIYNIYGFVRIADEIVDTFYDYPNRELFDRFKEDTYWSLENGISTNPVLNCFQDTVTKYGIDRSLIDQFLRSMEMDLNKNDYNREQFNEYVLGSAEVVGLMCLKVFVYGDDDKYEELKPYAMKLGAAFQKINFLRDIKQDMMDLGRNYFPELEIGSLNEVSKKHIEAEIEEDFRQGMIGIKGLPKGSRFGVYLAYKYYLRLFKKISNLDAADIMKDRIRIPDQQKASILLRSYLRHSFNLL